jgi:hypothetical protein
MRCTRTCVASAIAALVLVLGLSPVALAAGGGAGNFTVTVSPGSVAGGAASSFTVAIHNGARSSSRIGAVNLTPPAGFRLVSAALARDSQGSVTTSGSVVRLRKLNLRSGSTLTVSVTADSACAGGHDAWRAAATNEPSFSGRAFTLEAGQSHLSTSVTASCSLRFSGEPADTAVGQVITGTAFNPSGLPIRVEVLDANGHRSRSSSVPVTMSLASNPGGGTLHGTTTVKAVDGVATFRDLSIDKAGKRYALLATSPGLASATSRPFTEATAGTTCPPGQTCTLSADTTTSSFDMTSPPASTSNTLSITVDLGTALVCNDYPALDPNWFSFNTSSTSVGKVVTYTVLPTSASDTPSTAQFCLGAPYDFATRAGNLAPPGTLPDGTSGFIGLLPDCGPSPVGPCVDRRATTPDPSSPTGFDIVLTVTFPAGLPGDPIGRV